MNNEFSLGLVIQRSVATKDLGYIHVVVSVYVTEILPPSGRLDDKKVGSWVYQSFTISFTTMS